MVHALKNDLSILWAWFVKISTNFLPDAPFIMRFRGWLYGFIMPKRGKDFQVGSNVRMTSLLNISVGNHVYIAPGSVILSTIGVIIEDEVMLAFNAVITDGNHTRKGDSFRFGVNQKAPVLIKRGSWLAAGSIVLPGVTVGCGSVLAANSVATKDIPDHCIAGGIPAKIIKQLNED